MPDFNRRTVVDVNTQRNYIINTGVETMITLLFTNGHEMHTRCHKPAAAIKKAIQHSPVKGSIAGTKLVDEQGNVFGIIDSNCSWERIK